MESNPLVSIIMAAYNAAPWIQETIESVIAQTYQNWELIITEDCSTDNTREILSEIIKHDSRIKVYYNVVNRGPADSRNNSLKFSNGEYIAYLDSDDLWMPEKLEKQIEFMQKYDIAMCYTSYETIEVDGSHRNIVHVPKETDYKNFLKRPISCSFTVMFNLNKMNKNLLIMPNIRRGQDGATWCQVLKSGVIGQGLDLVLAKKRAHADSLSANKLKAIKRTWYIYRKIEKLSIPYSGYYFVFYAFNAINKRRKN